MEVRRFGSFAEADFLREEINALNRVSYRPDPFSTFEFLENFLRHDEFYPGGAGLDLWLLTAFEAGRLVGYLPLKRVAQKVIGIKTYTLSFLVTRDTDRPHLVSRQEYKTSISAAFYDYLLRHRREWSFLEWQQQDAASPLFPPPVQTRLKYCSVRQWPSMENATIPIRWTRLADYFQSLSKNSRVNIKRLLRRLQAGKFELLASSDPSTTPALLQLYQGIERYSWKSHADADIGRHPRRVEYFRGLLDARQPMKVTIQVLLLEGVPIAGFITGAFLNGLYALHIVYDERYSRLAPGSVVLLMGIRQAINGGFDFFNLLSGFTYYKRRWLAQVTETRIGQIYRVGGILFWRRLMGDLKRRWFPAPPAADAQGFNPQRRELNSDLNKGISTDHDAAATYTSPEERQRIDALVTRIRQGRGEFLSMAQLMPVGKPQNTPKQGVTP